MRYGLGLGLSAMMGGYVDPSAALLATLRSEASQLIMHPLEYGSMFQDRAGTIPVTESGQLVGLALDWGQSGGMPVPGPELVTNGGFDTAAGWTLATGWTISGGVASFTNPTGSSLTRPLDTPMVAGRSYQVTLDMVQTAGTGVNIGFNGGGGVDVSSILHGTGPKTFVIVATLPRTGVSITGLGNSIFSIDNVSVRELPGYHATAISDSARGIFRDVGGKRWVEYNGVNTAYQTPVLPAPGVDKAQVFAGVRKLSDAAFQVIAELSPSIDGSSNGAALMGAAALTGDGARRTYLAGSKGTTIGLAGSGIFASPITNVVTALGDISGDLTTLRVDGIQVAQYTADQGTGNYNPAGSYPLYYGARAGTSAFFNGYHYRTLGPIVRLGTNATPEQIAAAEAYYSAGIPA